MRKNFFGSGGLAFSVRVTHSRADPKSALRNLFEISKQLSPPSRSGYCPEISESNSDQGKSVLCLKSFALLNPRTENSQFEISDLKFKHAS
jgi:hypothetical protein